MELLRIQRERTSDLAYNAIKAAIVSGGLAPGERINRNSLARDFGTSITPVKAALDRLTGEGYVVTRPRAGTTVADKLPEGNGNGNSDIESISNGHVSA